MTNFKDDFISEHGKDAYEKIIGKNMLMLFPDEPQTFGVALASIKEMEK